MIDYTLDGLAGSGTIRFSTRIKAGRGDRRIGIEVPPELICKLADLLRATKGMACETSYSRPAEAMPGHFNVGHAVWHLKHPEEAVPCIDQSKVIDMRALTAGDAE